MCRTDAPPTDDLKINFICSVAGLLRGDYTQSEHGETIGVYSPPAGSGNRYPAPWPDFGGTVLATTGVSVASRSSV